MTQQANYAAIKNAFMVKARTLTDYFAYSWQVTDDDADANRGAKYFMILKPGSVPVSLVLNTKKIYSVQWNIVFDLQVKYKNYKQSWDEFTAIRDAVLNLFVFTTDKTLTGIFGIWDITMTAPEPPGQKPPEATPLWLGQQITAVITQQIDVTR